MLLEQIAKVGAFAALAPIIAACTRSGRVGCRRRRPRRPSAAPRRGRRRPRRLRPTATTRTDAGPVARDGAVHLQLGRLHRRDDPEGLRGQVRDQGQVRQVPGCLDPDHQDPQRRRRRRLRPDLPGLRPTSRRWPATASSCRSTCRSSRTSRTSARAGRTRRTTRATSSPIPNYWWTTGHRLGPGQGQGGRHQLGRPLGREVQGQARDAVRPAGGLRGRRRSGWACPPNPTDDAELDAILALLETAEAAAAQVHRGRHRGLHERSAVDDPGVVR